MRNLMMKLLIEDIETIDLDADRPLMDIVHRYQDKHETPIVLARANNRLVDLWYKPVRDTRIEFLDVGTLDGIKSYRHSLVFLLLRAFKELFPHVRLLVAHSLGRAFYICPKNGDEITDYMLTQVRSRMLELSELDEPFVRTKINREDAIKEMENAGLDDKVRLLKWMDPENVHMYTYGPCKEYFFRPLVPSTGVLTKFLLEKYHSGFLLGTPSHSTPTSITKVTSYNKLFQIFQEYE